MSQEQKSFYIAYIKKLVELGCDLAQLNQKGNSAFKILVESKLFTK